MTSVAIERRGVSKREVLFRGQRRKKDLEKLDAGCADCMAGSWTEQLGPQG